MLDLSNNNPQLDLKYRIDQYKIYNSPAIFEEKEVLAVYGMLRRNKPFQQFIPEDDVFETSVVQLMIGLSQDIKNILNGFYAGYTVMNRFILFYHPDFLSFPINRDNLVSLMSSRGVNYTSDYYKNPMCLISAFQVPRKEVGNILAYHKMSWQARRDRLLGQQVLGIPVDDTSLSHQEVLKAVENQGYRLSSLSSTLRDGFFFSPFATAPNNLTIR